MAKKTPVIDYFKKQLSTQFGVGRAKCLKCGHKWNVIYLKIKGGEKRLECPKCGARQSELVDNKFSSK